MSLGVKKVLQALSFIKAKTASNEDFKKEVAKHLKDSDIKEVKVKQGTKIKNFGFCISLNTSSFYQLKSASYGFTKQDGIKLINDSVLKDLDGFKDYKKSLKNE